ncbi:MAG: 50S ribosomal protein L23 [Patescibacteria group bacterium]
MSLINKLFKKTPASTKVTAGRKKEEAKEPIKEEKKAEAPKKRIILESKILISSHTAEKALMDQKLNHYVFKVSPAANKIMIANEVKKNYNVKVIKVNIVNIPKKARRVGRTKGFRAGYKKAIVTLAPGQTIELK